MRQLMSCVRLRRMALMSPPLRDYNAVHVQHCSIYALRSGAQKKEQCRSSRERFEK